MSSLIAAEMSDFVEEYNVVSLYTDEIETYIPSIMNAMAKKTVIIKDFINTKDMSKMTHAEYETLRDYEQLLDKVVNIIKVKLDEAAYNLVK